MSAGRLAGAALALALHLGWYGARAAAPEAGDPRIRTSVYDADEVYRLQGYVGFQIDLEFERDEHFVGLGAGDAEGLTFAAQDNHLFLKPRAAGVDTNLTVLTTRRTYHFEYLSAAQRPDPQLGELIYALRFVYPAPPAGQRPAADAVQQRLAQAPAARAHNLEYGYCGSPGLKPQSAWDDGVQTHLRFGSRQELPAIFVRNEDGSEALINFNIDGEELVVHRVARRFIVRRGRLQGCIVNRAFAGAGAQLSSGTLAPAVQRVTREAPP